MRTCSIDGCDRPHNAQGLCMTHYGRTLRHGEPRADVPIISKRSICTVPGCEGKHCANGFCDMHYQRLRNTGRLALLPIAYPIEAESSAWKGDQVGYPAAHTRVVRARGPASQHACRNCGCPAQDWAYDHLDPHELIDSSDRGKGPYSTDANHYLSLCRSCHKTIDSAAARGDLSSVTVLTTVEWVDS